MDPIKAHEGTGNGSPEGGKSSPAGTKKRRSAGLGILALVIIVVSGFRIGDQLELDWHQAISWIHQNQHWILLATGTVFLVTAVSMRSPARLAVCLGGAIILGLGGGQWYLRTHPVQGMTWNRGDASMIWIPPGNLTYTNQYGNVLTSGVEDGFWIDTREFSAYQPNIPWERGQRWNRFNAASGPLNNTTVYVSWIDAMNICKETTEKKWPDRYEKNGRLYRLPTTNEWIYATIYNMQKNPVTHGAIVFQDGSRTGPQPQHEAMLPEKGLQNMEGNVWEWCLDSVPCPLDSLHATDMNQRQSFRAAIGGGWNSPQELCQPDSVIALRETDLFRFVGFRMVLGKPILE